MFSMVLMAVISTQPPMDTRLVFHTQGGPVSAIPAPMDDKFVDDAQRMADKLGEAVVVTQGGKLVVLVNPRK